MADYLDVMGMLPIAGALLLFCAVIFVVGGVNAILSEREHFGRRLVSPGSSHGKAAGSGGMNITLEDGLLERFDAVVTPTKDEELAKIRQRLTHAGYRRRSSVRVFYAAKAALGFGFAVLAAIIVPLLAPPLPMAVLTALVVVPGLIGYFLPSYWVERQIEYRRQSAELGFPDLLDMLLICIEAGNSLDQGTRRVARDIQSVNPVLSDELGVVNDELNAGKGRSAVFRDFASRLSVPDISSFAAVLRQSDEYGVSIAETLRVYASELRNKRLMRAEEKANLMPIKLALGSILFTIPPTMLIMAGPSLIMIVRSFSGMGQ